MATILGCNDLHLTHKTPSGRTDHWPTALFAKLEQIRKLAVAIKADAVALAGDLFHTDHVSYQVLVQLIAWAYTLPCPFYVIPGNHDLYHDRLDSIPKTPYGVLVTSLPGLITDVSYQLLPAGDAYVTGVPYPDALTVASFERIPSFVAPVVPKPLLVMAHCFAEPVARDFFGTPVHAYADLAARCPHAGAFLFGHDHADLGVAEIDGRYFINIGALGRGSLTHEEVTRDVAVAIITTAPWHVKLVRLQVSPATEVFDLQLKAAKDREATRVGEFVLSIAGDLSGATPVDFSGRLASLAVADEVRREALAYIARAEQQQFDATVTVEAKP